MTEPNLPFALYVIVASILGLVIGSFLNVVIHRVPLGESIVFPGSHCPACGTDLRAYDNIPIVSFVLLRGRCRNCSQRISWRYPLVEVLTACMFAAIVLKTGPTWEALLEMVFAASLIALVFIDAIHHLLPNVITYPAIVFAMAAAVARAGWGQHQAGALEISIIIPALVPVFTALKAAVIGGLLIALAAPAFWLLDQLDLILYNKYFDNDEIEGMSVDGTTTAEKIDEVSEAAADQRYRRTITASILFGLLAGIAWAALCVFVSAKDPQGFNQAYSGLWRAVAGALVGSMPIWWLRALWFYIRGIEGMGLGDVKLMAIIGAFLGWQGAFGVMLIGSIAGSVIGAILMWRSKTGLKTALPFGVCLGTAALIAILTATPFFNWYVELPR
ncbi:MAG: prepilin peptidase [Acidobacteriota bacterium]|nr:prepilin peptidase [Acidobacteriota bacterium]